MNNHICLSLSIYINIPENEDEKSHIYMITIWYILNLYN